MKSGEENLVGEQKNMWAQEQWSEKRGEKKMVGAAPAPACSSVKQGMRSKRKESPTTEGLIIKLICVCILRVYTHKQTCTVARRHE